MKTLKLFSLLLVVVLISACGNKSNDKTTDKDKQDDANKENAVSLNTEIPENYESFSSADFGFDLEMKAPAETEIYTSILMTDKGTEDLLVVQLDPGSNIKLFIRNFNSDFGDIKEKAEDDFFNKFDSYIIEKDNIIVYKAENSDGNIVHHLSYKITKGNNSYLVYTDSFSEYDFETINTLYAIAKSIK
jgi:hypothetical protein